jgi:dipeptidyl aminopeptidase/acylaminoacyl peptidase
MMRRVCTLSILALTSQARAVEPEATARKVLAQLVAHDFATVHAHMTPQMTAAIPAPDVLAAVWQQRTSSLGKLQSVESVQKQTIAGMAVSTLRCAFEQGALYVRLSFDAEGRLAGLFFPPMATAPWSPPPYDHAERHEERDITIGAPPLALEGKLTLPHGAGPFPAIVLVHGSGSTDENETVGPIAPFHDLAVGLASRGVAVLRYQKRSFAHPEAFKPPARYTVREETIDDARAAVEKLTAMKEIDRRRIFVVGHSLGGMLAPRIADHDPHVAGLVILAGGTRPLEEIIVEQMKARGTPDDVKAAEGWLHRIRDPKLEPTDDVECFGQKLPATYFLDLRGYSPADLAARLDEPILVLHGDRDIQVGLVDFEGWRRALSSRPRARLKRYPTLTHLFTEGAGAVADYEKPAHVASVVIDDIAAFINEVHR